MARLLAVHFPHWVSPVVRSMIDIAPIAEVLQRITAAHVPGWDGSVKCMQSMLFVKGPGMPGQAWHQDERFIPTRDRSLIGVWIALDDATVANGCLEVIPGSHRAGYIHPFRPHGQPGEFDPTDEAYGFDDSDTVMVEVSAGTVVFFNGYLLHRSQRNRSDGYRRALVNHYCNAWSLLPWSPLPEQLTTLGVRDSGLSQRGADRPRPVCLEGLWRVSRRRAHPSGGRPLGRADPALTNLPGSADPRAVARRAAGRAIRVAPNAVRATHHARVVVHAPDRSRMPVRPGRGRCIATSTSSATVRRHDGDELALVGHAERGRARGTRRPTARRRGPGPPTPRRSMPTRATSAISHSEAATPPRVRSRRTCRSVDAASIAATRPWSGAESVQISVPNSRPSRST